MKCIQLKTKNKYDILIKNGLIKHCGEFISKLSLQCRVCIITDSNVAPIYANKIINSLINKNFIPTLFVLDAGEKSKSLLTIEKIYNHLADNSISRSDMIISLGGGVVGDIAGFAAATYNRGIQLIQIPTSFLAQVDSSIGGKNGINLDKGKNLVGTFHQPKLVIIDPEVLQTLPSEYFLDGIAEAIKCAFIKDKKLFEILRAMPFSSSTKSYDKFCIYNTRYNFSNSSQLETKNISNSIEEIIFRCINIKKDLVEKDEFDNGERMLLNFGHTIGHALEKIYDYKKLSHGQAISIGMSMITKASENIGLTQKGCYNELINILNKYSLPIADDASINEIITFARQDKKNIKEKLNLVLIKEIGEGFIHQIPCENFCESFSEFLSGGNFSE